jgi:hypothetical protein
MHDAYGDPSVEQLNMTASLSWLLSGSLAAPASLNLKVADVNDVADDGAEVIVGTGGGAGGPLASTTPKARVPATAIATTTRAPVQMRARLVVRRPHPVIELFIGP